MRQRQRRFSKLHKRHYRVSIRIFGVARIEINFTTSG